jgi:hypothetical protein
MKTLAENMAIDLTHELNVFVEDVSLKFYKFSIRRIVY